ncbi:hypothetical protein BDN72DRAFT_785446 [Pluteus cervinus]|uniref:Uncharacterized protein n=1 Tax=Pluteus cervinus TaxID=181527 RepID=A0ACD3BE78_9AGAR|nr:hypothetical protein BDN72DRAFT_785446 [Pluteus cervinus]
MANFLFGDELGNIRALRFSPHTQTTVQSVFPANSTDNVSHQTCKVKVAVAYADGTASAFILNEVNPQNIRTWREPRLKHGQRYVGLATCDSQVLTCTSNGALRMTQLTDDSEQVLSKTASLPMRLNSWKLSKNNTTFAYGGEEVDLSVCDTERVFIASGEVPPSSDKGKRKRKEELLPGEIWRAKNVSPDNLGLRQPIRITSLSYLDPHFAHQLIAGTEFGDLRHYDTRAARRPIANYTALAKVSGIKLIQPGSQENQVFFADSGCNLSCIDIRNGRVAYSYKGMSGAVNSIAVTPHTLASTAHDRYMRIHTHFPVSEPGEQQEVKGEIVEKHFATSIPTAVVAYQSPQVQNEREPEEGDEDGIWDEIELVEEDSDTEHNKKKRRQ